MCEDNINVLHDGGLRHAILAAPHAVKNIADRQASTLPLQLVSFISFNQSRVLAGFHSLAFSLPPPLTLSFLTRSMFLMRWLCTRSITSVNSKRSPTFSRLLFLQIASAIRDSTRYLQGGRWPAISTGVAKKVDPRLREFCKQV